MAASGQKLTLSEVLSKSALGQKLTFTSKGELNDFLNGDSREAWTPRARASPLLCGPSVDVAGCVPNNFVHASRLGKHRHMT